MKWIGAQTWPIVSGPAVEAIVQAAEEEKVDLINISRHDHSAVVRVFYGSVAVGFLYRVLIGQC